MIRWLLALGVIAVAAAVLVRVALPIPASASAPAPTDEILAYRLVPGGRVAMNLPPEIEGAVVTTWGVLSPLSPCDPSARHAYALHATLADETGRAVLERDIAIESRASCDPRVPEPERDYAARLAEGEGRVLDPRTTTLLLDGRLPRGGSVALSLAPGDVGEVLLRVEGRYLRGALGREAHERSLDLADRHRAIGDKTALGFVDLPEAARERATTGWARRLEAIGREGDDYEVRRLLLRDYRVPIPAPPRKEEGVALGPRRAAALNVEGPLSLDVTGPAGAVLRVTEGLAAPREIALDPSGVARVWLGGQALRTVVVEGATAEMAARFAVRREDARALVGDASPKPLGDGLVAIAPDVRVARYMKLDPREPLVARIAPGQEVLALAIRAELAPNDARDEAAIGVAARWTRPESPRGPGGEHARASVSGTVEGRFVLPRSRFERWASGGDATDARVAILNVPAGVDRVEIRGDAAARVQLRAPEPGQTVNVPRAPYRRALAEGLAWRYAPLEERRWAPIRPEGEADLERAGRVAELEEQVRIERVDAAPARPEHALAPEGTPLRRWLLVQAHHARGAIFPPDAWSIVPTDGERALAIASEGSRAGLVRVLYRAHPTLLGHEVLLRDAGAIVARAEIATLSGTLRAQVPPGVHRFRIEGLGPLGLAYADAAPAEGGPIVRRRDVYELRPGGSLQLAFRQGEGETLTVVLFVVAESLGREWSLSYAIDRGAPARVEGRFFRVVTRASGTLSGRAGDAGCGLLWEAKVDARSAAKAPHGIAKAKIALGDDLVAGRRTVTLKLDRRAPRLWIAAVLHGRAAPDEPGGVTMWPEDE